MSFIKKLKEFNLLEKIDNEIKGKIQYNHNLFLVEYKIISNGSHPKFLDSGSLEWFLLLEDKGTIYNYLYNLISEELEKDKLAQELDLFQIIDVNGKKYEMNGFDKRTNEIFLYDNLKEKENIDDNKIVRNIVFRRLNNKGQIKNLLGNIDIIDKINTINEKDLINNTIISLDITMPLPNKINQEDEKDFLEYILETNRQATEATKNIIPLVNYIK